ncbi:MAG: hypothetical protein R3C60_04345 [Parvularculaceae bacterium]
MRLTKSIPPIAALALLSIASCASASQQGGLQPAAQKPAPPCQEPLFRQFDFWAGDWDVFNQKGDKIGENKITIEEYGCLLVEHWVSPNGITGQSYNYVDLSDRRWRQVWVAGGGTIDYKGGLDDEGSMVLDGFRAPPSGSLVPYRGMWTPNEDGTVTQRFFIKSADGEEWTEAFNGTYRRKPAAEPESAAK